MITLFFFFNDTATTEIYTLSLHDALPIFSFVGGALALLFAGWRLAGPKGAAALTFAWAVFPYTLYSANNNTNEDRKSTRLNSSHANISYAVFCLKKKKLLAQQYLPDPLLS